MEEGKTAPAAGHKAGFVNIVGNPNVGKSTLMNDLVGERLSIITSKAQTTRHRITGIVNTPEYQIVYSDTPGVLKPKYKLQESMLGFSQGALTDADILLYVTDTVENPEKNKEYLDRVAKEKIPVLLVINKIDLLKGQDDLVKLVDEWKERLPGAEIFPTSATEHFNIDSLKRRIVELLPDAPPYFGKDALTDKPARFFVTEIIREKLRQGGALQHGGARREIRREGEVYPHNGSHLRGTRLAERHHHRQRRRQNQEGGHRGQARH